MEQGKTITDKLLDAFPEYYGRFICLLFARFLNEPLLSQYPGIEFQSAASEWK